MLVMDLKVEIKVAVEAHVLWEQDQVTLVTVPQRLDYIRRIDFNNSNWKGQCSIKKWTADNNIVWDDYIFSLMVHLSALNKLHDPSQVKLNAQMTP